MIQKSTSWLHEGISRGTMKFSRCHSINRVKQTLECASRKNTVRAARVRISCLQWLGRWGSIWR